MKADCTYKSISDNVRNAEAESIYLNKQVILSRMTDDLPASPWADIEISAWSSGDDSLPVEYDFYKSSFGEVLAANTPKGVCYLGLINDRYNSVLADFKKRFKHTEPIQTETFLQKQVVGFLDGKTAGTLLFHLRGTPYQTEIWKKLIRIPFGNVISYATLGESAVNARAAGTANGRNPVFWIIPCHRAVKNTGEFNRYFWGEDVKKKLLAWEFANSTI